MSELRDEGVHLSKEAYKENFGSTCPNCGSDQLEGNAIYVDTGSAYQEVSCTNCGSTWDDEYELTGYARLNVEAELDIAECSEFVLDHLIHHKAMPTVFQQNDDVEFEFDVFSRLLPEHIHMIANHILHGGDIKGIGFESIQHHGLDADIWLLSVADKKCIISQFVNPIDAQVFDVATMPALKRNKNVD